MNNKIRYSLMGIVLLTNIVLWYIPSNVIRLIARERPVLMGYYSVEKITGNIFAFIGSCLLLYFLTTTDKRVLKKRLFRFLAILIILIPGLVILDLGLRYVRQVRYVGNNAIYHRPPNTVYKLTYHDVPEIKKSYPEIKKGYPDFEYRMTTDKRGFRNQTDLPTYDMVLLGDSFTEGSEVSDEQTWAVLLAKELNKNIYNLGMSGSDPLNYLVTFEKFGLEFKPKTVICTIYEGNDFRRTEIFDNYHETKSFAKRTIEFIKASPIRHAIKNFLIYTLEDINLQSKIPQQEILQWLPLEYPEKSQHYYAFPPKRVMEHYQSYEDLVNSEECKSVFFSLNKLHKICTENNIRFIVALAPTKTHVLLPLIKNHIPQKAFYEYCHLREKKRDSQQDFFTNAIERLEVKEQAISNFCQQQNIEFISYTKILRENLSHKQVYFTYDQHWTPEGHILIVNYLKEYLR